MRQHCWRVIARQLNNQFSVQHLVFAHEPLLLILLKVLSVRSAFIERETLQPVLELPEL